jgi:methylitaconate Delta-isomerase
VAADETDLVSRLMFMQRMHKTYAGTSTVCTGVASRIPGTVVHEVTRPGTLVRDVVRIGHPAGVIETESRVDAADGGFVVRRATLGRTARRILEGVVYVPDPACS